MSNLLCLLAGVLLPLVVLLSIARRGMRPMAAATAYRNLAWKLSLEVDRRGQGVRGYLDGRRLWIAAADPARGAGPVAAELGFTLPMAACLRVRPRGVAERLRRRASVAARAQTVGDADLDAAFEVSSVEVQTAAALWTEAVRDAMLPLKDRWRNLWIDDDGLRIVLPAAITSEPRLRELIDAMRRLAHELEAARDAAPLPEGAADTAAAWASLAERQRLTLLPNRPAVTGELNGRRTIAALRRDEHGPHGMITLFLKEHRPTGLVVHAQRATDPPSSRGQDIVLGDPAFDDAFVVKGYDPGAIRAMLNADCRSLLSAMAARGTLSLTDSALELTHLPVDPAALEALLDEASAFADRFGW
jgi:hypothetical protein